MDVRLNGVNVGRLNGWLPKYTEALGYYDTTNQVKRVKCELFIDAGAWRLYMPSVWGSSFIQQRKV
ncbi:MAG: hypothetical protein ACLUKN_02595 [Bacilli bacterium]